MKMKHRLSGDLPIVRKDVEPIQLQTFNHSPGNDLRCVQHIMQVRFRDMEEIRAVPLRYHQRMAIMNGVDVENGDDGVILVQDLRRKFVACDLAKHAIR